MMRKFTGLFFTILFASILSNNAKSQTIIFSENFNSGTPAFSLNTSDLGCDPSNGNFWVINNSYNSIFGNTPAQPAGITGAPGSKYLHIKNAFTQNATFQAPADGNVFAKMNAGVSTIGNTGVSINFWLLCNGDALETNSYFGRTYYSIDGGNTWVQNPIEYSQIDTWTQVSITNPVFDNQADLRLAFMWVQISANEGVAVDPAFSVDEIVFQATSSNTTNITTGTVSGSPFCPGSTFSLPFTTSGTFDASNQFTVQLSDQNGSFVNPVTIGSGTGSPISCTIPGAATSGSGYLVRVVSSSPATVGNASSAFTISSNVTPSVSISSSLGTQICSGSQVTFTATPTNGGLAPSYSWTLNGANVGSNSSTYTSTPLNSDAVINLTMVSNDACANGVSSTSTFSVSTFPSPVLVMSSTPTNCGGSPSGSVTVNISSGSPATSFTWDTNPVSTTSTVTNLGSGMYHVVVGYGNACTITDSVFVNASGIVLSSSVIVSQTIESSATGSISINVTGGQAPYSYLWNTNPPQVLNSATGLLAGNYSVIVTDNTGCSVTFNFVVPNSVGIDEKEIDSMLEIFPNPISSNLNIKFLEGLNQNAQLKIFNANGQEIYFEKLVSSNKNNFVSIDFSKYSNGIYLLQITNNEKVFSKKLIKN